MCTRVDANPTAGRGQVCLVSVIKWKLVKHSSHLTPLSSHLTHEISILSAGSSTGHGGYRSLPGRRQTILSCALRAKFVILPPSCVGKSYNRGGQTLMLPSFIMIWLSVLFWHCFFLKTVSPNKHTGIKCMYLYLPPGST